MAFSGGNGTSTDPYQITTVAQLNDVRNYLTSYFILMNDLDLNVSPYNTGSGWTCIGTDPKFSGSFNGNGYIINNLFINSTSTFCGLFGRASGATFKNIGLTNVNITGGNYSSALVTLPQDLTIISNCFSTGTVSSNKYCGGLIGNNYNSTVNNCFSTCTVGKSGGSYTGGLTGISQNNDIITNSYSTGNVLATGSDYVGGFCGYSENAISNCFYDSTTSGKSDTGNGTPKTTTQMQTPSTFSTWGSGETDPWLLTAGSYPELRVFVREPIATNITITSIISTASSQAIVPTISTAAIINANINSLVATSTSQAKTPIITTTTIINANINSVLATASNQAISPIITAEIVLNASIMANRTNCTSQSITPLISVIKNEISQLILNQYARKPIIQAKTASNIINQLSRQIRTEVM